MKPVQRNACLFERSDSRSLNLKMALGFSAAFVCWLAHPGRDEPFAFETLERCVDGTNCGRTAGNGLDFDTNQRSVRAVTQAKQRQEHDMLKLTEILALRHNFCIIENIGPGVNGNEV